MADLLTLLLDAGDTGLPEEGAAFLCCHTQRHLAYLNTAAFGVLATTLQPHVIFDFSCNHNRVHLNASMPSESCHGILQSPVGLRSPDQD